MFDPEEIPQLKQSIRECAVLDRNLLDDLRKEVSLIKPFVKVIKPRSITTLSLVASESTNNKLVFDPFYFQLIRVVDSNGKNRCMDTITPTMDTDLLSARQFHDDGKPRTPLGLLMRDLNCKTLNELSPMIPSTHFMKASPERVSKSWVLTYKDLCEWAVIYDTICYGGFTNSTIIVKDGLLRSKIFRYDSISQRALFIEMMQKINAAIRKTYDEKKVNIYLVGLAKHSQVLSRYSLVMQLDDIFPKGEPRFARVPLDMEAKSYVWKEYMRKEEGEEGEINKYSLSSLYLVRFGDKTLDPVWAIDLLQSQTNAEVEIFGYLLMDTIDGFPVPNYPACLQKALEHAQIVDFDLDILQDEVVKAIRAILPSDKQKILDQQVLSKEMITNRQI